MSVALVFDHHRVRNVRIRKAFSRQEVEAGTGVRLGVLRNIEEGLRSEPTMATLRKLASFYGCEVVDFYREEPVESTPDPLAVEGAA